MSLTLYEQETVISYNREEEDGAYYTANPNEWRRLEKGGLRPDHTDYDQKGSVTGKIFIVPKSCLVIGVRLTPSKRHHVYLSVSKGSRTAPRTNVRPNIVRGRGIGQGSKAH